MQDIVIVGFGFIAEFGHAPFYLHNPNIRVVGIADSSRKRLEIASRYFPNTKLYGSSDLMFQQLKSKASIVDICAPPNTHFELIIKALSCGFNVLCEKPLVISLDQAIKISHISRSSDLIVFPCHNYKYSIAVQTVRRLVSAGEIGTPLHLYNQTLRNGHALGVTEWNPHWRRNNKYALGGILVDHGAHSIYMASELLQPSEPIEVSCLAGQFREGHINSEDTVHLNIKYRHGEGASLFLTWSSAIRSTKYRISGTSGIIDLVDDTITISQHRNRTVNHSNSAMNDPSHSNWFEPLFLSFTNQINHKLNNGFPDLQQAALVAAVIEASYQSADKNGLWIKVDDFSIT